MSLYANRTVLEAEIARLEAATPSRIASFNESRAARLATLRAQLTTVPLVQTEEKDEALEQLLERADAASTVNRRAASWR